MTAFRCPMALPLIVLAILVTISSAAAQSRQSPQVQIQTSAGLQRQALQSLNDPDRAKLLIDQAYAELRAALSTLTINASSKKLKDPLLSMQARNGEQALSLLQAASDLVKISREPREEKQEAGQPGGSRAYLDEVRKNLEQASRLTNALAF